MNSLQSSSRAELGRDLPEVLSTPYYYYCPSDDRDGSWHRSTKNWAPVYSKERVQAPSHPSHHNDFGTKLCSAIHRMPFEPRHRREGPEQDDIRDQSNCPTNVQHHVKPYAGLTAPASEAALVSPRLRAAIYVHCITRYSTYTRVRRDPSSIITVPRTKRERAVSTLVQLLISHCHFHRRCLGDDRSLSPY